MLPFILFYSYMSHLSTHRVELVIVIQHKDFTITHPSCSHKMYVRHGHCRLVTVIAIHSTSKSVNLAKRLLIKWFINNHRLLLLQF